MNDKKDDMITPTRLISDRGWTKTLCNRYLSDPDQIKPNPNYRQGAPMSLYLLERVRNIEKSKEFREDFEKAEKRKKASKKAVVTKKKPLLEWANNVGIELRYNGALKHHAITHYNNLCDENYADLKSADFEFLKRISGNFLRHECIRIDGKYYDYSLDGLFNRVGRGEAYNILRKRIDELVNNELQRQLPKCN